MQCGEEMAMRHSPPLPALRPPPWGSFHRPAGDDEGRQRVDGWLWTTLTKTTTRFCQPVNRRRQHHHHRRRLDWRQTSFSSESQHLSLSDCRSCSCRHDIKRTVNWGQGHAREKTCRLNWKTKKSAFRGTGGTPASEFAHFGLYSK